MSAQFSSARPGHRSTLRRSPQRPYTRVVMYMLTSLLLGALFIFGAEMHIRAVEHLRAVGVQVEGMIAEAGTVQVGNRTPGYFIAGEYTAHSPSGIALTLPFRFNLTAEEARTYAAGDALALIYNPDFRAAPIRLDQFAQEDPAGLRGATLLASAAYVVIGIGLSVIDWRLRSRRERHIAKLRSAFGAR